MTKSKLSIPYETNPFKIGTNGVTRLFSKNQPVAVALIVINLIVLLFNQIVSRQPGAASNAQATLISIGMSGISAFFSLAALHLVLASLHGKTTKLQTVIGQTAETFLTYLGFIIVYALIVIGGFVMLIIPGIVFSIWFSLVMYARFDSDEGGVRAALKRSKFLVRNRGIEFIAVSIVGSIYSLFGLAGPAVSSAVMGEWYGQLVSARDANQELPKVHAFCYVVIVLGVALLFLLGFALIKSLLSAGEI